MLEQTISKIEAALRKSEAIPTEKKSELLELVGALKSEVAELSQTHSQEAQNIAGLAAASAEAATDDQPNPEVIDTALKDLSASVRDFEGSHPRLVDAVNRIAYTLSSLGI